MFIGHTNGCNTNDSLILYLPLNGNANDESGLGFNGIIYGTSLSEDRFGFENRSFYFDGVDDYIAIEDFGNAVDAHEITVSVWVKNHASKAQFQLMFCPDENRFAVSVNYYHDGMNTIFWDFGWQAEGGDAQGGCISGQNQLIQLGTTMFLFPVSLIQP